MDEDIQDKVWNIERVVEDIQKFPQTYGTILKDKLSNGTCEFILRRKLNALCQDGTVCKSNIPGTRFTRKIFYCLPKAYTIIVENTRIGVDVFAFFEFQLQGTMLIKVNKYWKLQDTCWQELNTEKIFLSGNILKWI
jgi:hypothetical protein